MSVRGSGVREPGMAVLAGSTQAVAGPDSALAASSPGATWRTAARVVVSVALLWAVFRLVDAGVVVERLAALRPSWVAVGLAISVLQVSVLAWRWRYTAARLGIDLPFGVALTEYYLGIFLNQVLPGGVAGDVSRAWRHAKSDVPPGPAIRAVILERLSAQIVMTLVAAASILALPVVPPAARMALACALGLGLMFFAWTFRGRDDAGGDTPVGRLFSDARAAVLTKEAFVPQLATAIVVVASYILVFLAAARAVGVDTPVLALLPLVAPVLMTMLIPVSVAGWGLREAAAATLWAAVGLTAADGAAVSVAYGLVVLASSGPGLFVLMRAVLAGRDRRAHPPPA